MMTTQTRQVSYVLHVQIVSICIYRHHILQYSKSRVLMSSWVHWRSEVKFTYWRCMLRCFIALYQWRVGLEGVKTRLIIRDNRQKLPSSLQQTYMFGVHAIIFCVFKRNINIRGTSIIIMHVHVTNLYIINDIKQR